MPVTATQAVAARAATGPSLPRPVGVTAGCALLFALLVEAAPVVGGGIAVGSAVYAALVLAMRVPEARQIVDLFAQRFRRAS